MLGLLGTLVTAFFLYGIIVPLTNGALTIAAADRILGGRAEWREVWMLLFRRLGKLLSAVIPAAIVVTLGCLFFVIPGLVLALFFAFVSPVVLIEGLGGRAALERSTTLVRSDWLRVALVLMSFAVVRFVAQLVANIFVAPTAIFVGSLLSDLFTMVMLPIPVLGTVLLYFDVRRKRDNFTNDNLRADLDALKSALVQAGVAADQGRGEREARPDVHPAQAHSEPSVRRLRDEQVRADAGSVGGDAGRERDGGDLEPAARPPGT